MAQAAVASRNELQKPCIELPSGEEAAPSLAKAVAVQPASEEPNSQAMASLEFSGRAATEEPTYALPLPIPLLTPVGAESVGFRAGKDTQQGQRWLESTASSQDLDVQ